jgi:uncharacterized membrane protein
MTVRRRFATLLIMGAIALGGSTLGLAGTAQASSCGQSSAGSAYGGQGQQLSQGPCQTTSGSALPFTGLDLALVVGAGGILIGAGVAVRWLLRHGGQQ